MVSDISKSLGAAPSGLMVRQEAAPAAANPVPQQQQAPKVLAEKANETPENSEISLQDLDNTVSELNAAVQNVRRDLQFRVDEDSGRTIITVRDSETDEIIREIPPERVVALAKNIESLKGILFSAEA